MTPRISIIFDRTSSTKLFGVDIVFLESGEQIGGTFSTDGDSFEPSWYSSDEAEALYDEFWEDIEEEVIKAFYDSE